MERPEVILLSIPQFAQKLGVTAACIRRWIQEQKITIVKLGRVVRIPAEEIDRLVRKGIRPAKDKGHEQ